MVGSNFDPPTKGPPPGRGTGSNIASPPPAPASPTRGTAGSVAPTQGVR